MRKKRLIVLLVTMFVFMAILASPAFAVDIEHLRDLFINDPDAAVSELVGLIETDPDAVVLVLAKVAEYAATLDPMDPLYAQLSGRIQGFCVG
ncbi:hypothetical protein IBX65_09210, partial [Candidatus Aerophobetes bacterium]|nr:hypothetical protein [Candidatus Aerophobetes bacterium]